MTQYNVPMKSTAPGNRVALITPSDATELNPTRGISFAAEGALAVEDAEGNSVTIPSGALAAGVIHPLSLKKVKATGTTATGIVGYW